MSRAPDVNGITPLSPLNLNPPATESTTTTTTPSTSTWIVPATTTTVSGSVLPPGHHPQAQPPETEIEQQPRTRAESSTPVPNSFTSWLPYIHHLNQTSERGAYTRLFIPLRPRDFNDPFFRLERATLTNLIGQRGEEAVERFVGDFYSSSGREREGIEGSREEQGYAGGGSELGELRREWETRYPNIRLSRHDVLCHLHWRLVYWDPPPRTLSSPLRPVPPPQVATTTATTSPVRGAGPAQPGAIPGTTETTTGSGDGYDAEDPALLVWEREWLEQCFSYEPPGGISRVQWFAECLGRERIGAGREAGSGGWAPALVSRELR